jgi:importin subunit alpha-2
VINAGAVPVLVKLLSSEATEIQFEALWCLINITGGNEECAEVVVKSNVIESVVPLLNV